MQRQDRPQSVAPPFDLVLMGGRVIDPGNGIDACLDVGLRDGRTACVAPHVIAGSDAQVVDITGLIVTPGLVDIHTHVYPFVRTEAAYVGALNADAHLLASGVTTTVDAGTVGWRDFADFKSWHMDRSKVRILAMLNIAAGGMVVTATEQDPAAMQPGVVAALASAHPDTVVGIKSAHYWVREPWDEGHPPWISVDRAVEAGGLCGLPVMVDFWPRPPKRSHADLLLRKLRPGDIQTHFFAQQFPIVGDDGHVLPHLRAARERGVVFDLGHGAGSFWFRQAVPALRDGFAPDTISTDLHMANVNGPVFSMLETMSKCLCMGMDLADVVARSTVAPARVIGRRDLGTLTEGAEADLAVLAHQEGSYGYADCGRARMRGSQRLTCEMTLRAGEVVYDRQGLSMPDWERAPDAYWRIREVHI